MSIVLTSIDVFRLVAFFCVVILHAGFFEEYGFYAGVIFRLLSRWAVPFFFMLTGFFIFHSVMTFPFQRHVAKLLRVFVVSSCIYFLVNVLRHDDAFGSEYYVFAGTYLHLWFLNSMLVGLLLFWLLRTICSLKALLFLALFLYLFFSSVIYLTPRVKTKGCFFYSTSFRLFLYCFRIFHSIDRSPKNYIALVVAGTGLPHHRGASHSLLFL